MVSDERRELLLAAAIGARDNAQPTYSEYHVGAAILTADGTVYTGCNVENVTYTLTIHAEQNALSTAIANGHTDFEALAIATEGMDGEPPCGVCRQTLAEYCDDEVPIYSATTADGEYTTYTLGEIFPNAFRPSDVTSATSDDASETQ